MKAAHEKWGESKFFTAPDSGALRVVDDAELQTVQYYPIRDGRDIFGLIKGAHAYGLLCLNIQDEPDLEDLADELMNSATAFGESWFEVELAGFGAVRRAERELDDIVRRLHANGLAVSLVVRARILTGGSDNNRSPWRQVELVVGRSKASPRV